MIHLELQIAPQEKFTDQQILNIAMASVFLQTFKSVDFQKHFLEEP